MRKRYRVLLLAAIVAAFIVPVGFALSLESDSDMFYSRYSRPGAVRASAHQTVMVPSLPAHSSGPTWPLSLPGLPSIPEGVRLFFVGGVFLGLAAIMRRAA